MDTCDLDWAERELDILSVSITHMKNASFERGTYNSVKAGLVEIKNKIGEVRCSKKTIQAMCEKIAARQAAGPGRVDPTDAIEWLDLFVVSLREHIESRREDDRIANAKATAKKYPYAETGRQIIADMVEEMQRD